MLGLWGAPSCWRNMTITNSICYGVCSVQFSSVTQSCPTLCNPMDCSMPGFSVLHQFLEIAQTHIIKSVMLSNLLILCHPLLLLPSIFPRSGSFPMTQFFISGGQSIAVSASASVLSVNIQDFKMDFNMEWLDLLEVQGILKSSLQHHRSKASILQHSAFFRVQLSNTYMTTGKTKTLTRQTFVGKVMSLLLNMLSRLVITFLPRSKRLLISWLQSPFVVILEPRKIKAAIVSTISPSICHDMMGPDDMILVF